MAWIKKTRDTRFLDLTAGIESGASYVSGRLLLRRRDDEVSLILDELVVDKVGTTTLFRLGSGFRPFHVERDAWWQPNAAANSAAGSLNVSTTGYVVGYQLAAGLPMTARMTFDCPQSWPATYPGTEVQL